MSKKAQRFERSSGWSARSGGSAEKKAARTQHRADISEGSCRMADGGEASSGEILKKERVICQFRQWEAEKRLGKQLRCPLCELAVNTMNFERHVRRVH